MRPTADLRHALAMLFVVACSSTADENAIGGSNASAGAGGADAPTANQVILEVVSLQERDDDRLDAMVQLSNGVGISIPLSHISFRLLSSDGVERLALSGAGEDACGLTDFLSSGEVTTCSLRLDSPPGTTPDRLIYSAGIEGRLIVAEADAGDVEPCTRCGGLCTDLSSDPDNCGECGLAVDSSTQCVRGVIECLESVQEEFDYNVNHCGGCGNNCSDQTLSQGAYAEECVGGVCRFRYSKANTKTCDQVCAEAGGTCVDAACPGNGLATCAAAGSCDSTVICFCE